MENKNTYTVFSGVLAGLIISILGLNLLPLTSGTKQPRQTVSVDGIQWSFFGCKIRPDNLLGCRFEVKLEVLAEERFNVPQKIKSSEEPLIKIGVDSIKINKGLACNGFEWRGKAIDSIEFTVQSDSVETFEVLVKNAINAENPWPIFTLQLNLGNEGAMLVYTELSASLES